MRVALAQINSSLGCFSENASKIIQFAERAKARRCELVVFPEASLFGYHPMDLLEHGLAVETQLKALKNLQKKIPAGIAIAVGAFTKNTNKRGKPYYNSAVILQKNKKPWTCHKELLPTYDVFDDARHIQPGDMSKNVFKLNGKKILVTVCEDIWAWSHQGSKRVSLYGQNPLHKIRPGSIDFAINLSASPYFTRKAELRRQVTEQTAKYLRAPLVYVNMVGSQDELVFDGGSFALDGRGKLIAQSIQFEEDLNVVDLKTHEGGFRENSSNVYEGIRQALVLGIRDFTRKTGIEKVHLGLSGGIDSAVVACLAVDALGPERVSCYFIPGPFSSALSLKLAHELAKNIGIQIKTIDFISEYRSIVSTIDKAFGKTAFGIMHENLQARFRALVLMAIANRESSLLLNTSNKTEIASGYGTMYGDMCGGLSPLGDLLKRDVVGLAKLYNAQTEIIPQKLIQREPTAELRRNQKDQDTLPAYSKLDSSVARLVEQLQQPKSKVDRFLLQALVKNEFKRWQFPPILKVRERSFGQGRRMPIAAGHWYK